MRYAVIRNGLIDNVIEWDGKTPWEPPVGCSVELCPEEPIGPGEPWVPPKKKSNKTKS